MANKHGEFLEPMEIVGELVTLPHRGATTDNEKAASDLIERHLEAMGARVERQSFRTPRTYLPVVWSIVCGLSAGILVTGPLPWLGFGLTLLFAVLAFHYFDWRPSPLFRITGLGTSQNVVGKFPRDAGGPEEGARNRVVLMAHYDSAPVSLLYAPSLVRNFRRSLLMNLGVMAGAVLVTLLSAWGLWQGVLCWIRYALAAYFVIQGVLSTVDYLRYGFTQGAADNATGVAAALATAQRLFRDPLPGWDVEVVLTGAEEVGMLGARAYYLAHKNALRAAPGAFVLNFDNVGSGSLRVVTRTGTLFPVKYEGPLVEAALETASGDPRFSGVVEGRWHTGDFDSIWFQRGGISSLTLSAQDEAGLIAHLHRPEDTLEHVDPELPALAVDFAEATIRRLAARLSR